MIAATGVLSNDTDLDIDPLTATISVPPVSGSLSLNLNGGFVYTPALNFTGQVQPGHTYCFRSRGLDKAGNLESYPGPHLLTSAALRNGDTCVAVISPAPGVDDTAGLIMSITSETPFYGVLLGSAAIHRGSGRRMQARYRLKRNFT